MDKRLSRKKFYIHYFFVIFAFAIQCTKDDPYPNRHEVIISDANPVQFWLTGEESFNEKSVCSIYPTCFCQPFSCDDTIRFQLTDTDLSKYYDLKIYGQTGLLATVAYNRMLRYTPTIVTNLQFANTVFPSGLTPWQNNCSGDAAWSYISPGVIKSDGTSGSKRFSCYFYTERQNSYNTWPPGTYTVRFTGRNDSTGANAGDSFVTIYGSNNGFSSITSLGFSSNIATGDFVKTVTFTTSQFWTNLGFQFGIGPPGNVQIISLNEVIILSSSVLDNIYAFTIFDATVNANDYCDQQIEFRIVDHSNGNEVAHSDCIFISDYDTDCTQLIEYSNSSVFAGLHFIEESPSIPSFYLRIPAVFFFETYPQEQEDLELSDDTIETLWSKTEAVRTMDIGFMPDYMHKKMSLITQMDTLISDGKNWRRREGYQITQGSKRFPLRKAMLNLAQQDFINRNVL